MGKRDYRKRESKKPKKDKRTSPAVAILPPIPEVEVIKKGKKEVEE